MPSSLACRQPTELSIVHSSMFLIVTKNLMLRCRERAKEARIKVKPEHYVRLGEIAHPVTAVPWKDNDTQL